MTYWDLVCRAADEAPERVLLADDFGRTLTTTQLRDAAERTAAALPVSPGDTVSWSLPTGLEAAVLMVALTRLGVRQNPVIPAWRHRELRVVLGQLEPTLFISPETWRGFRVGDMLRELGAPVLAVDFSGDPGPELRLPVGDVSALPPVPGHDGQWVYYSSGTTSDPKGVRHTDSSLMASAAGSIELAGLRAPEVYPIAWPLTHIGGVTMLTCTLAAGLQLVLFDTWDPATTPSGWPRTHRRFSARRNRSSAPTSPLRNVTVTSRCTRSCVPSPPVGRRRRRRSPGNSWTCSECLACWALTV